MVDDPRQPRTGRVRIIGAAPAGKTEPTEAVDPEPPVDDDTELLHWTEAPTGQVPAVLADGRDDDDDPWGSLPEPTWREERSDWAAHEDSFDPSMLAADPADEPERQPWAFDLDPLAKTTAVPAVDHEPEDDPTAPDFRADAYGNHLAVEDYDDGHDPLGRLGGRAAPRHEAHLGPTGSSQAADDSEIGLNRLPAVAHWDSGRADAGEGAEDAIAETDEPSFLDLPPREEGSPRNRLRPGRRAPLVDDDLPGHGTGAASTSSRTSHQRGGGGRNIPAAIATGVAVGAIALLAFHFGTVSSMVVVTAVVGLAALEGYAAFRKAGYHPATLLGLVAVVGVMVGAYNYGEAAEPLVIVLLVAFTLLWHLLRVDSGADPVRSSVSTVFVYAWVGVFGSYAALLLSPTDFSDRHGIAYLLGALITVVAYDVAALAVGGWVGRRPLSAVSPNKTWEGLIGGSVVAIAVAVGLVHLIHPWTIGKAAALGVLVVILAPIGDLAESMVKRHVGLKDMGRLLPGHGGLLDRIDGLLFVLPATYYLVRAFHLG